MKVIIAGCRFYNDYKTLKEVVDTILQFTPKNEIEIVSGGATGADALGERYAKETGYPLKVFPADWEKFGRKAGPIRNEQMAQYATHLIAFWDGWSKGTQSMIEQANKHNLKVRVWRF